MALVLLESLLGTFLVVLYLSTRARSEGEYYWRDWNGTAPEDAFIAGTNENETIYIVQAYVEERGIFATYARENETEVFVNTEVYNPAPLHNSSDLKVLCTQGDPFEWIPMTISDVVYIKFYYDLFVAGFAEHVVNPTMNASVHVGRVNFSEDTYVGSVYWGYQLHYSDASHGRTQNDFEILVMRKDCYIGCDN